MSTQSSLIHIEGIGPVLFKSDRRCRRLSIRLKPFEGIIVIFPPGYSIKKALTFVEDKRQWILNNKGKIEVHENRKTVFDENTVFRTRSFELKVQKQPRHDIRMTLESGILKVVYPQHANVADAPIQNAIRHAIERALRIDAKVMLPYKVERFAKQYSFQVNKVFIKNLKSRWGSCSSVNNINLNLQLMRLPEHLIDYVILHELCHTSEKNHGPRFWKLLDKVTEGKAKQLAGEMKEYRTTIY